MVVKEVMSLKPITIRSRDSLYLALNLMRKHNIRHLPVVDEGRLRGIITESDIRGAFLGDADHPSAPLNPEAMTVCDHMTQEPVAVAPGTHIEDAALLIYKKKIGALPVVQEHSLVGIISIMDILGLFVDMMGILHSSSRLDVVMGKDPKNFEKVSKIINDQGINIISVGMSPFKEDKNRQTYIFRLDLCETGPVVEKITSAGFQVISAMD
ncbi:MAG: CBS domain-containing protein [Nitrospinaceae bacterium]|jgi:acetoin utilization protein AcuB|nr:MAG: CBS domain-containing protein [Nitrospinaceae bacterium]